MELDALDVIFAKELLIKHKCHSQENEKWLASFMQLIRQGHRFVKKEQLENSEVLKNFPSSLISEGTALFPNTPLVTFLDRIYLQKNWVYETYLLELIEKIRKRAPIDLFQREAFQLELESKRLTPSQKEAVEKAFESSFFVLTGGPGTGKTYTATVFLELLSSSLKNKENFFVKIAAPTGKAAFHLQEKIEKNVNNPSFSIEAKTLHRLLHLTPGESRLFSKEKIDADLIIVDEASMMDIELLCHLLERIPEGARLILMGDPDQLPPVESTGVFQELSNSFGHRLDVCHRLENETLKNFVAALQKDEIESVSSFLKKNQEALQQMDWDFDEKLKVRLFEMIQPLGSSEKIDEKKALNHYQSLKVLNALRQGPYGVDSLNQQILKIFDEKGFLWRALPILITANDPRSGLYNGMTGVLIHKKGTPLRESFAYFPDQKEPVESLPPFEIAFCISIHKSQGSEYGHVLALFPESSENFGKESLYTAVTRAKKTFKWVGKEETLLKMMRKKKLENGGCFRDRLEKIFLKGP